MLSFDRTGKVTPNQMIGKNAETHFHVQFASAKSSTGRLVFMRFWRDALPFIHKLIYRISDFLTPPDDVVLVIDLRTINDFEVI